MVRGGAPYCTVLGGAPYRVVRGGVSIRRSPDPATDGLTDDRIPHGGNDGYAKDADSPATKIGGSALPALRAEESRQFSILARSPTGKRCPTTR